MLIYRKQSMNVEQFFQMLQYLLAINSVDITAGEFKYDLLKMSQNKWLDIFADHAQIVHKPTHISESLIDHVYINKALMDKFITNITVENIYFSDHEAVRIVIEKISLDFYINPLNTI